MKNEKKTGGEIVINKAVEEIMEFCEIKDTDLNKPFIKAVLDKIYLHGKVDAVHEIREEIK